MNGRTPPELPTMTLPVCGIGVQLRPLGRTMLDEIRKAARKAHQAPDPPLNTVTGLDGAETQEPNPSDPDYLMALATHTNLIAGEVAMRVLKVALAYESIVFETDARAVARVRKAMAAADITLDEDDRSVYLWHVLIDADEDMVALVSVLMGMSEVTEEAVAAELVTF